MDVSTQHSQLKVISNPNYTEYRFYKNKKAHANRRDAGFETTYGSSLWLDALVTTIISYLCYQSQDNHKYLLGILGVSFLYVYWRCSEIIYESVIVLSPLGVQLETHRGPFKPLFVSRRFIPAAYIQDVIINEALRRWNVRYYLAVIVERPGEDRELAVAFENTLPRLPILLDVYHGVLGSLYGKEPLNE